MSDNSLLKIIGNALFSTQKTVSSVHNFVEKLNFLGFYFSASWCPSCIAFTPELIKFYNEYKKKSDNFEIIYVNSDCNEKQFNEQCNSMPWFSIPFSDRSRQTQLARHFRVHSIPALVIVDIPSGNVVTTCGRAWVVDDPLGNFFPWRIRNPIEVLLETSLNTKDGNHVSYKSLTNCIKGLYFAAHWCPPCKAFTPLLAKLYERLNKGNLRFEIIFISSDLSEESFHKFFSTMPWLAVPYSEEKRRKELTHFYEVGGIPFLIILDENNAVITKEGRIEVNEDPTGEDFPWRPKLIDELSGKHISKLNEEPCLIIFTSCEEKELDFAHYTLSHVAEEYQARLKRALAEASPIQKLNFFYAGDSDVCESIRESVGFGGDFPLLIILDIPNGKKYICDKIDNIINSDTIGKFVRDFLSQKLVPSAIKQS